MFSAILFFARDLFIGHSGLSLIRVALRSAASHYFFPLKLGSVRATWASCRAECSIYLHVPPLLSFLAVFTVTLLEGRVLADSHLFLSLGDCGTGLARFFCCCSAQSKFLALLPNLRTISGRLNRVALRSYVAFQFALGWVDDGFGVKGVSAIEGAA